MAIDADGALVSPELTLSVVYAYRAKRYGAGVHRTRPCERLIYFIFTEGEGAHQFRVDLRVQQRLILPGVAHSQHKAHSSCRLITPLQDQIKAT